MPWWILKQPNGTFARFSTVVDDFTHMNMSRQEAEEVCANELGTLYVPAKMRAAEEERATSLGGRMQDRRPPLSRWHEALENLRDPSDAAIRIAQDVSFRASSSSRGGDGRP